jgi:hypothetical protein
VAVDPSVHGNELREFGSEKCVNISKIQIPESKRNNGPLISKSIEVIDLDGSTFGSYEESKSRNQI